MRRQAAELSISVVIPTRNRAALLRESLESLTRQSLRASSIEVVVVDDGSPNDQTKRACRRLSERLNLQYVRIDPAGIAAAKNVGIFASRAPILFFFDDDDVAAPDLLAKHLAAHQENPDESVAVLGYTTWAPALNVTPLMHYVTDVGGFLFCYGPIRHRQWLDFTYFWGGRSSCKRSLLAQHGIFNQAFTFGCEDIELAYRLRRFGLRVVHDREACQYMNRPVTFDEFCARCERQGRSQWYFSQLHPDREIQTYCQVDVLDRWGEVEPKLAGSVERVREIEAMLRRMPGAPSPQLIDELHALYRFTFNGHRVKGLAAARGRAESAA